MKLILLSNKSKVVSKVFKYSYIVIFLESKRGQNLGKGEFIFYVEIHGKNQEGKWSCNLWKYECKLHVSRTFNVQRSSKEGLSQNFCVGWGMKVTSITLSNGLHVEHKLTLRKGCYLKASFILFQAIVSVRFITNNYVHDRRSCLALY